MKKNEIGFSIDYKNLKNLKEIIKKQDYKKMQENIKKAQKKVKVCQL